MTKTDEKPYPLGQYTAVHRGGSRIFFIGRVHH